MLIGSGSFRFCQAGSECKEHRGQAGGIEGCVGMCPFCGVILGANFASVGCLVNCKGDGRSWLGRWGGLSCTLGVEEGSGVGSSDRVWLADCMLGAVACDGVSAEGVVELARGGCLGVDPECRWEGPR